MCCRGGLFLSDNIYIGHKWIALKIWLIQGDDIGWSNPSIYNMGMMAYKKERGTSLALCSRSNMNVVVLLTKKGRTVIGSEVT